MDCIGSALRYLTGQHGTAHRGTKVDLRERMDDIPRIRWSNVRAQTPTVITSSIA